MIEDKMVKISLTISESQHKWLDAHPEINRSQLFRKSITEIQSDHVHRISPLLFLMCSMSTMFGVILVAVSFSSMIGHQLRLVLSLSGGVMAVMSSLIFLKERNRIHKKKVN